MLNHASRSPRRRLLVSALVALLFALTVRSHSQEQRHVPDHVPPKRSSQIQDGFGINSDCPRSVSAMEPLVVDAHVRRRIQLDSHRPVRKQFRPHQLGLGGAETRGVCNCARAGRLRGFIGRERNEYPGAIHVRESDVHIALRKVSPTRSRRNQALFITTIAACTPSSGHPTRPEQIAAFNRYVKWMVNHFHGRIHYWALWNEQDIGYWNPWGNPEEYGKLLAPLSPRSIKPIRSAKVIYGGQADPIARVYTEALDTCKCAAGIDIFAYHTYPGYGQNLNPEAMDYGAYRTESPREVA